MRNEVDQVGRLKMYCSHAALRVGILAGAVFFCASARAEISDDMRVLSALNEPLRVQMALNVLGQFQTACAKAHIESMEGEMLGTADVQAMNVDGKQSTLLMTREVIREPAVNVVLQTGCDSKLEHVYPILLDLVRSENAVSDASVTAISNPESVLSEIDAQTNRWVPSGKQILGGIKLQLAHSLSGTNLLSDGMGAAANTLADAGDDRTAFSEEKPAASAEVDPIVEWPTANIKVSGMRAWASHYWQPVLGLVTALIGLLILSFWRSAHPVSRYSVQKSVKRPTAKQVKARVAPSALEPIPYSKPDMTLFASTYTASQRPHRESRSSSLDSATVLATQSDNQIAEESSAKPPLYNAEEVIDEAQLAKLCMGLNQPLQAIEILEACWGQKQPNSALPWQCMLELYKITGDLNKYRELIGRYNNVFGDNAGKRSERVERVDYAEEGLRRRA
jgi:hypothetical protein